MNWSSTPPTKPGFYAWRDDEKSQTQVIILIPNDELEGNCRARIGRYKDFDKYGEWLRLVPAEEVERLKTEIEKAYFEAHRDAISKQIPFLLWETSRAKQIAEGTL